ncbi:hypothetical protein L7F22_009047, partial [Adiantum nelumboides]|nr:hypothetical protein [Adiantum nelumboides]
YGAGGRSSLSGLSIIQAGRPFQNALLVADEVCQVDVGREVGTVRIGAAEGRQNAGGVHMNVLAGMGEVARFDFAPEGLGADLVHESSTGIIQAAVQVD